MQKLIVRTYTKEIKNCKIFRKITIKLYSKDKHDEE